MTELLQKIRERAEIKDIRQASTPDVAIGWEMENARLLPLIEALIQAVETCREQREVYLRVANMCNKSYEGGLSSEEMIENDDRELHAILEAAAGDRSA